MRGGVSGGSTYVGFLLINEGVVVLQLSTFPQSLCESNADIVRCFDQ